LEIILVQFLNCNLRKIVCHLSRQHLMSSWVSRIGIRVFLP
jgi:hypothetical protein